MSEDHKQKENADDLNKKDFEAKQNAIGFFDLLLKIDRRNHPENYKDREEEIKC